MATRIREQLKEEAKNVVDAKFQEGGEVDPKDSFIPTKLRRAYASTTQRTPSTEKPDFRDFEYPNR